ncbi:MAG: hypothetical protein AB7S72_13790 [Draconibacterium sp.]
MKRESSFDFEGFEKEAIERLKEGAPLSGRGGIFTPLIKRILEASLEGELDTHLELDESVNRRNGSIGKSLKTSLGTIDLQTPGLFN